jgi:Kef-type K+ transport system membrane component KefB
MENELLHFFFIVTAAALAPVLVDLIPRVKIPVVVVEIALGVLIGPQVLGLAETSPIIEAFSQFGLAFLFFLAGFEIDFDKIKGVPLNRALLSWIVSLVGALALGGVLQAAGITISFLYVGLAMATTALGALLPMLGDAGELETGFGAHAVAYGALGEFGPIVMMALLLETERGGLTSALILNVFVLLVMFSLLAARRWWPARLMRLIGHTMHSSAQLAVRIAIFLIVGFVVLAELMGLDFLLGAFAAGLVIAQFVKRTPESATHEVKALLAKFEGIGFGLLIPIFFVVSGIKFDLDALLGSPTSLVMLPVFLGLFFVVRGLPALWFYRRELGRDDRLALGLFGATALPLVIAITDLGVESGRMAGDLATAMVGAAMLSVFLYPLLGFSLRRRAGAEAPRSAVPVTE